MMLKTKNAAEELAQSNLLLKSNTNMKMDPLDPSTVLELKETKTSGAFAQKNLIKSRVSEPNLSSEPLLPTTFSTNTPYSALNPISLKTTGPGKTNLNGPDHVLMDKDNPLLPSNKKKPELEIWNLTGIILLLLNTLLSVSMDMKSN